MPHNKLSGIRPAAQVYAVFLLILLVVAAVGMGSLLYIVVIQKPDGTLTTSGWPNTFTEQFSRYIVAADGNARLKQEGIDLLRENGLWFQLLDEGGRPVLAFGSGDGMKPSYSASALLEIYTGKDKGGAVFAGTTGALEAERTYLIGFPLRIAKVPMYLNGDHFSSGRPIVAGVLLAGLLAIVLAGYAYGWYLSRQMRRVTKSVAEIASRAYLPMEETGAWGGVYGSLNRLDGEIRAGDVMRESAERLRREWIENITHDLKTPLSPIMGYAELLADSGRGLNADDRVRYGAAILKSADRVERLIGDMKLIYQMDSGIVPVSLEKADVARLVREVVIDLLNDPEYQGREIDCACETGEIYAPMDASLFRRAVGNLVTNALAHNPKETRVWVSVAMEDGVVVCVRDDGRGLTPEEQKSLFERYARGTGFGAKPEGSGLGMAIVRQIVGLHGGRIDVRSAPGAGTSVTLTLPCCQGVFTH